MVLTSILSVIFSLSFFGTLLIKNYAKKKQIIDIPNSRSSHKAPTPRGGGLSFVIVFLSALLIVKYFDITPVYYNGLEFLSLSIIALLGFYDDKKTLSPLLRLLVQIIAVSVFLVSMLPLPSLSTSIFVINSGILLNVLIVFYLIWLLNLYNFMDGINGIASLEAISVCFGMCVVYWLTDNLTLISKLLFLMLAVLGFLPWNFPKAKIFMGDAGSSFLGFILGIFSLQALVIDGQLFWCWIVLLGVFIVDASITLLRRLFNGEKIYLAHCSHAYQRAARKIGNHASVTLFVILINVIWLLPIAILIGKHHLDGFFGVVIAYLPLCALSFWLGAGKK